MNSFHPWPLWLPAVCSWDPEQTVTGWLVTSSKTEGFDGQAEHGYSYNCNFWSNTRPATYTDFISIYSFVPLKIWQYTDFLLENLAKYRFFQEWEKVFFISYLVI